MYEKLQNSEVFNQVIEQGTNLFGGFAQIVDSLNDSPSWSQSDSLWTVMADWITKFIFSRKMDEIIPV